MCKYLPFKGTPPVMESRDMVSFSRRVSRPIFEVSASKVSGLGFGLEGSRSRALRLETLHRLFLLSFARSSLKNGFKK